MFISWKGPDRVESWLSWLSWKYENHISPIWVTTWSRNASASKKFSKKRSYDAMNMSPGRQKVGLPKLVEMFAIASQLLNGPFIFHHSLKTTFSLTLPLTLIWTQIFNSDVFHINEFCILHITNIFNHLPTELETWEHVREAVVSIWGDVRDVGRWIFSKWGGGGRALPKYFGIFSKGALLVNKGVYFFQDAINLNFKLFLGCICIVYIIF